MRFGGLTRAFIAATVLALAGTPAAAQSAAADEGWPASERVLTHYKQGKYALVVAEAPAVMRAEPWNNELKLAYAYSLLWTNRTWEAIGPFEALVDTEVGVDARLGLGNALAWSGRMHESLPHYRRLLDTPKRAEAKLGLANALSWSGREDLAIPLYEELRAAHPKEDVGVEGLFYARRAVRGKTTAGFTFTRDNSPTRRREPALSHVWRDASRTWIFGVEASGGEDWNRQLRLDRREYGLRVESLDLPLAPRLTVSRETEPRENTFAEVRLKIAPTPLYLNAGRVNWGKQSFTLAALDQGLTANRVGIEGNYQVALGELRGFANHYSISDDNDIVNGDVRLAFRWRPWVREVKPFVGVAWRYSDRTDPDYWSPRRYAVGYVGLEGEWAQRYWTVTALVQAGFKLAGEASSAWAAVLSAKRWIGDDWAVGVLATAQSGTRQSKYRAESVGVTLEKLW